MAAHSNQRASQWLCLGVVTSPRRFATLGRDLVLQMTTVVKLTKMIFLLMMDVTNGVKLMVVWRVMAMMVRILNYCFRWSSSMQAKVPRHGKNHVQEIFLCQRAQKGSNWGKMWHLQFQWKFVATSVLHHNLAPLIFVPVSTFIFVKKADRQKNYTLKHVIMKIGFHMYQNWSNIWYKPSSLHFRRTSTSQTVLTTMTPCIAAPENATVGTTSVDIWRWAFQLGGPIPILHLRPIFNTQVL